MKHKFFFMVSLLLAASVPALVVSAPRVGKAPQGWRTVVEGPNGTLYFMTNNRDGRGNPRFLP